MWFATADGLNRYDGSDFKIYRRDPYDPNSLSHNIIRTLFVDQRGLLWIGTWGGGLNQYDREKDAFIRYQHSPDDPIILYGPFMKTGAGRSGWGRWEGSTNSIVTANNSRVTNTILGIRTA